MKLVKALSTFSSILSDTSLTSIAQIYSQSFTRNRKISLKDLLFYLVFRNHNVISEDIAHFFTCDLNDNIPTKQAMIKRMNILNFDVWQYIQNEYRNRIYNNIDLKKFKYYIVIAVDGSFADLPPHIVLNHYFGGHQTKKITVEKIKKPQAKLSMVYDVLNDTILDFSISHYRTSEIPLMFDHLKRLEPLLKGRKVILLADRYYGSAELFKYCQIHGYKYLIRAKKNFFKHEIARHSEEDFCIERVMDKAWIKRITREVIKEYIIDNPLLEIRVIRGKYRYVEENPGHRNKTIESDSLYFTNLDADEFTMQEIIDLYHCQRWRVETAYDVLKNDLNIEQVNVHNPIGIMNEINAKVIFYNIERLIYQAALNEIPYSDTNKYQYQPNNKNIINILHTQSFITMISKRIKRKIINSIIKNCAKEKVPKREGRHYKRWNKYLNSPPSTKHRIDGRRNPPIKITKVGILTNSY